MIDVTAVNGRLVVTGQAIYVGADSDYVTGPESHRFVPCDLSPPCSTTCHWEDREKPQICASVLSEHQEVGTA